MEELNLLVSYLFPFKSYFQGFPVIKFTYVPYFKIAMLYVKYLRWSFLRK